MTPFVDACARYEAWLGAQLGRRLVRPDLAEKHRKMRADPHAFLRATCFRFAEAVPSLPGDLAAAPRVLAVGDLHVENFGLWRDVEGRLVWGVNDFDEAARLPWTLDLVRLGASALLSDPADTLTPASVAAALLEGYARGLAEPRPRVLLRDGAWLRREFQTSETERQAFWDRIDALFPPAKGSGRPDAGDRKALTGALPAGSGRADFVPRTAGLGSLGRPRFVARAMLHGAPVVREVKAVLPSCFIMAGLDPKPLPPGQAMLRLATGPDRAPDPWFRVADARVVRRLAPDSRKIEGGQLGGTMGTRLLRAMAAEAGALHAADRNRAAVAADLAARGAPKWLARAVRALADMTMADWRAFREASR